jgi:iron(III) transport system permease protein
VRSPRSLPVPFARHPTGAPDGDLLAAPRSRRIEPRTLFNIAVVGLLIYLVMGPLAMLLYSSLRQSGGLLPFDESGIWTLQNYVDIFLAPLTYRLLATTLVVGAGALAVSFSVAIFMAWLVERTTTRLSGLIYAVMIASLGIPSAIAAITWTLLLNPTNGLVNLALRGVLGISDPTAQGPLDIYTIAGMVFVQGLALAPITFLLVVAAFRAIDASLEEAAATSGAEPRTTFRRITIRLLTPALLSALVYQFVTVVETFDVPLVIGLRSNILLLSTEVYRQVHPASGLSNFGIASVNGMLLLLLSIGPLIYYNWIIARSSRYASITGHGFRVRRIDLGRWRFLTGLIVAFFTLVVFVLPVAVLVWTSLQPFFAVPSPESIARLTLAGYADLLGGPLLQGVIINTAILAVATALATVALGTLVAWIVVRSRSRWRTLLDGLAFMPHAMPGVIIAVSILLMYLLIPVPVYGTIWIIVIALATQYVSLSSRLMGGSIAQLSRQLEEAAETSGASFFQILWRIVLPLVRPAAVNGILLVILLSVGNLTMPLVLSSSTSQTLSTLVYFQWYTGNVQVTAVAGVVLVAFTVVLSLALRRVSITEAFKG